ncbi:AraC family transcriptional regulator [Paenibacillus tarimensis]
MTTLQDLKENTYMPGKHFQINIFHNISSGERVLYMHWHEHLEILFIVNGRAVFDIGGASYEASAGDLLFVHSGELHSGYAINNMDVDYYAIVIGRSLLGGDAGDPLYGPMILPFMDGRKRFPAHLPSTDAGYEMFAESVRRIITEFEAKQPGYELSIRAYLQLLVSGALRRLGGEGEKVRGASGINSLRSEQFEALFAFIREEYKRPIGLPEAAQLVNMSISHFCKTFKRLTGRTFIEYVNLYRVNESEKLLLTTGMTVTEAAEQVGFSSIHYFIRTFKSLKHYSPSQCKRRTSE